MSACLFCDDTGYHSDGSDCSCDARPLRETPTQDRPEPNREEERHQSAGTPPALSRDAYDREIIEAEAGAQALITAIDELLGAAKRSLGPLIALGEITRYRCPIDEAIHARITAHLDEAEGHFQELPGLVAAIREELSS